MSVIESHRVERSPEIQGAFHIDFVTCVRGAARSGASLALALTPHAAVDESKSYE